MTVQGVFYSDIYKSNSFKKLILQPMVKNLPENFTYFTESVIILL